MLYGLVPVLLMVSGMAVAAPARHGPAHRSSKYFQTDAELKRQWMVMENECRGGQHASDDAICKARDDIGAELTKRGICWAYSDWRVFPTDYDWHPCNQPRPKGWRPS
jgi:hypothetical protein